MTCATWPDHLDDRALSTLDPISRNLLEAHAVACPDCGPRLATEILLAGAWDDQRRRQPSPRLQSALLAVPRQDRRIRAYSFWALPVSMMVIGLLAVLAPDVLRRQRAEIDAPAGQAARDAALAPMAATAFAGLAQATPSPMAAGRAAATAPGATAPGRPTDRLRPAAQPRGRAFAPAAASATAAPPPPDGHARLRGPRENPAPTPTVAPEIGATGAQPVPDPATAEPQPTSDPGGDDPGGDDPVATPEAGGTAGAGLRPGPAETATPEGPPSRQPEPAPPVATPTPEDPRIVASPTPAPTEAPGGGTQPIAPPTDTPTPTPTPTPTGPGR